MKYFIKFFCLSCEKVFEAYSILKTDQNTEICGFCHPRYTGKKYSAKIGKVDAFRRREEEHKKNIKNSN